MGQILNEISDFLDRLTGIEGSFGYTLILVLVVAGYTWTNSRMTTADVKKVTNEDDEPDPPRNFTVQQLRYFDGTKDSKSGDDKPVYLSVNGTVFDVSAGRDFYGPEGPYSKFSGRECGIALAKMSFDDQHLDDVKGCETLNFGEKTQLEEWYQKFKYYRAYPVKGRLIPDCDLPLPDRCITEDELIKYNGENQGEGLLPKGYATAPIYVGVLDKVFDVSFGGVTFYGPNGPYHKLAGRNASRALATMSLNDEDVASSDVSNLTEKQLATVRDWVKTFEERKLYPIVGKLVGLQQQQPPSM